ncbi:hypothetical protein K439DRAFT_1619940 [Ramaria rubella]|nr:hypothetical protein K439DRAFT_1619937 [Ramaria rubella]KAF8580231.1 hypothetical protein K439DRAFT_1619940 [Ramaria rubella]
MSSAAALSYSIRHYNTRTSSSEYPTKSLFFSSKQSCAAAVALDFLQFSIVMYWDFSDRAGNHQTMVPRVGLRREEDLREKKPHAPWADLETTHIESIPKPSQEKNPNNMISLPDS